MRTPQESSKSKILKSILEQSKGVIFDFDGLLANSEPYHYLAYNEVFERYGHSLDKTEYWIEWTSKGKGIAGEIERHNLSLNISPVELRKQKFEVYSRYCQNGDIQLFPKAIEIVECLKSQFPLAIASGSWKHDIRAILSNAGAEHLFKNILGKESTSKEKPHPDIFIKAAETMECQASQCIVIEDALKGLNASRVAKMRCIIVRNDLNQNIDFGQADLVISSLAQFAALLEY